MSVWICEGSVAATTVDGLEAIVLRGIWHNRLLHGRPRQPGQHPSPRGPWPAATAANVLSHHHLPEEDKRSGKGWTTLLCSRKEKERLSSSGNTCSIVASMSSRPASSDTPVV